ncbi:MFS transporter [Streptomyces iranensis]|uniref:EmrB/QacA subfamily drug resistance transporter n=1 Tax=Streptomyces iranensis TaxID=576784 RepID=A0A061AC66_9ACTN|nr:MFS transporter [Streptomyces iranensis]MBP2064311.1 EmrB/QacA subfamily drug resistance transporter [Streptomyces iranensis]CDR17447.1 major facilitator superfamily MFS_1 [Streptomyces iranensis]
MSDEEGHPRRWAILVALCAALLVIVIDNTVLHVAVPAVGDAFDASTDQLQAVIDAYVVVFAGLLITAGVLSDRYGRRRVLVMGLLVFGAASALAAAAPSVWWLIAARALMGVGAALVMPATLAVLVAVFPERERPRAFAVWSAVASVGMAAGPLLGGALVDAWSWAGVFLINVPVVAVALFGVVRLVPETRAAGGPGLDPYGTVLVTAGMTGLVWALIEAPAHGYTAPGVVAGAAVAVVALVGFGVRQRRSATPMVDLRLYRDRRFSGAGFAVAVMTIATGSTLFVLSQYLQLVLGYSAFETGLAAVPLAVGVVAGSAVGGRAPAGFGARACIVAGFTVTAAGFAVLASLSESSGSAAVSIGLGLAGLGSGIAGPSATSTVLGAVPPERAGMGSALNDTHQQLGIALGVAGLGGLLATVYRGRLPDGLPEDAMSSLGATLSHARDRADGGALTEAARSAFTDAQSVTMGVGVAAALTGAAVALLALPGRTTRAVAPAPESEEVGQPGSQRDAE